MKTLLKSCNILINTRNKGITRCCTRRNKEAFFLLKGRSRALPFYFGEISFMSFSVIFSLKGVKRDIFSTPFFSLIVGFEVSGNISFTNFLTAL